MRTQRWTKNEFIEILNKRNTIIPYKVLGEYLGTTKNILVEDKYGICSIRANHLLNGVVPTIQTALNKTSYCVNQFREVHGNKYDYSEVKYKRNSIKVNIICKKHGAFEQTPNSHKNGSNCPICSATKKGKQKRLTIEQFIKKAKKIHNNKYCYSKSEYITAKEKIIIICPIHGNFKQTVDNHLQGNGCLKCARENSTWKTSDWERSGKQSKNFNSFKVYIVKLYNKEEEFYKIGKTYLTVEQRLRYGVNIPYNYEIIKIFEGSAEEMSKLEINLQRKNKDNRYTPKTIFAGNTECYKTLLNICQ